MNKTGMIMIANMVALLLLFGGVVFGVLAISSAVSIVAKLF